MSNTTDAKDKSPEEKTAPLREKRRKRHIRPRNYDLGNGIYRFSRTRMFHKKAIYKFLGKKTPKAVKPKKPVMVEKVIGGDKNGEKRIVLLKKRRANYPTADPVTVHHAKKCFSEHRRHTVRHSMKRGQICILLAGPHKGKRVVFMHQLKSGLLVVTGPFVVNGCPLRRVSPKYVIATSTRLNVTSRLPRMVNDGFFKRKREKRAKKEEGDIFRKTKDEYKPSKEKEIVQRVVDKNVFAGIRESGNKAMILRYLSSMFGLRSSQYPHRLIF